MTPITVFSKKGCVQCDMTKKVLEKKAVPFEVRMIDADGEEGAANMADFRQYGYSALPVVVAGAEKWAGFQPAKLQALAA